MFIWECHCIESPAGADAKFDDLVTHDCSSMKSCSQEAGCEDLVRTRHTNQNGIIFLYFNLSDYISINRWLKTGKKKQSEQFVHVFSVRTIFINDIESLS